jgi:deoxyadenosine/deoxycytidine kinase
VLLDGALEIGAPGKDPAVARVYISVSGNIGVGKSTFSGKLSQALGLRHYPEPLTNPYLADYYHDKPRWGFCSQVQFALDYSEVHRRITHSAEPACQDRSLYESHVFARALATAGILSPREFGTLTQLIDHCLAGVQTPDLLVYLSAPIPTLLERIDSRGLGCERAIDAAYLGSLQAAYDEWIAGFDLCPVLHIDAERYDFEENGAHVREFAAHISGMLGLGKGS